MSKTIDEIKSEINDLKEQLNSDRLSANQKQAIYDEIMAKKREIEKISLGEHKVVSVAAPVVGDQKKTPMRNRFFFSI
jgi:hypothetical protein